MESIRLLDKVHDQVRCPHYSFQTEKVYLYWARFFIRWHGSAGQMRHPRDMGAKQVEAFLTMLATKGKVLALTLNQALKVLPFFIPWGAGRYYTASPLNRLAV